MSKRLTITITVPSEATDKEMAEAAAKIAQAASEFHVASGGAGLVVRTVRVVESDEPVGWFGRKWLVLKALRSILTQRVRPS